MPKTAEEIAVEQSVKEIQDSKPPENKPPASTPPSEIVYELPDKTVIKGKDWEEVARKTGETKVETSRALRDREEQLRRRPQETREIVQDTTRPQFSKTKYQELFLDDPVAAANYLDASRYGITPDKVVSTWQETLNEVSVQRQIREIAIFHDNVPSFAGGNEAAKVLMEQLKEQNKAITADNLEAAFYAAVRAGKLEEVEAEVADEKDDASATRGRKTPPSGGSRGGDTSAPPDVAQWAEGASLDDLKKAILTSDAALRQKS